MSMSLVDITIYSPMRMFRCHYFFDFGLFPALTDAENNSKTGFIRGISKKKNTFPSTNQGNPFACSLQHLALQFFINAPFISRVGVISSKWIRSSHSSGSRSGPIFRPPIPLAMAPEKIRYLVVSNGLYKLLAHGSDRLQ